MSIQAGGHAHAARRIFASHCSSCPTWAKNGFRHRSKQRRNAVLDGRELGTPAVSRGQQGQSRRLVEKQALVTTADGATQLREALGCGIDMSKRLVMLTCLKITPFSTDALYRHRQHCPQSSHLSKPPPWHHPLSRWVDPRATPPGSRYSTTVSQRALTQRRVLL